MLNRCEFIGNLGRDPDVRHTASGDKVVNLTLAVSERWKDRQSGERKERTEWVRVTIWNTHLADVAEKYLSKGDKIYIAGSMQTRKYTDQQGAERYSTEIILQKFRGELVLLGGGQKSDDSRADDDTLDDEVPF